MPIADILTEVGINGSVTSLGAPGKALGATTINVGSTASWPTSGKAVYFAIRTVNPSAVTTASPSGLVAGTYSEWKGVVGTNAITGMVLQAGSIDQIYTAGTNTQVLIPVTASRENALVAWGSVAHDLQGNLLTTAVQTALGLGTSALNGWNPLTATPNTIVANGNRSYTCTFNGVDLTSTLSPGFRFRSTRTVAAGTQSTSLNGTTQYWSKATPNGTTFTGDHTYYSYIKLFSYPSGQAGIISRDSTTSAGSGFEFGINSSGQVAAFWRNASGASSFFSYQSIPLNKWVQVAAAVTVATPSVAIYIDGVSAPAFAGSAQSTSVVQPAAATPIYIGNRTGTTAGFFQGKIAQAAVFSSVLSQATIQSYYSQGLAGTEPTLISAFAFNGTAVDLNTTNNNNLTANGAAGFTTDAPWTVQASGIPNGTLDYGIVQSVSFATNTTVVVQVAEGCALPTSGGTSAIAYSSQKVPFGFPSNRDKWSIAVSYIAGLSATLAASWGQFSAGQTLVPIGSWSLSYSINIVFTASATSTQVYIALSSTTTAPDDVTMQNTAQSLVAGIGLFVPITKYKFTSVSVATPYYLLRNTQAAITSLSTNDALAITIENAYL